MRYFGLLLLLGTFLCLLGCSDEATRPADADMGSFASARIPAQLEVRLQQEMAALERELPLLGSGEEQDAIFSGFDVYAVVCLWGHLANVADPPSTTTDWTGMLTTTAVGHMVPLSGLFFEPGQDSLVATNANIHVAWVSFTEGDFDGVAGLLFVDPDVVYITPPTLIFNTAPFSIELPIYQLDLFYGYYPVDNVNSVAIHSRRLFSNSCPGGYLEGEWVRADLAGQAGTFTGLWLNHAGDPEGYFNGTFWSVNDGTRHFSGELSGYETDEVIAELEGVWGYDDMRLCPLCGSSHGWFRGIYVNLDGSPGGMLQGVFGDYNQPPEENTLPLSGTWKQHCPTVNSGVLLPATY